MASPLPAPPHVPARSGIPPAPPPRKATPKSLRSVALSFLGGAAMGGAVAAGAAALFAHGGPTAPAGWTLSAGHLPGFAALACAAVVLHELGHLLGGLAGGMRFGMFAAGPARISRASNGRLRVSRHSLRHGVLGFVLMLPDTTRPFAPQYQRLALGGPLASLVCAAAGVALALVFDGPARVHATVFAAWSALVFAMTAVPIHINGWETDGAQLLDLARDGRGTQLKGVILGLAGQSLGGTRPRELDRELISRGLALASDSGPGTVAPALAAGIHLYAALHADDRDDDAACGHHLAAVGGLAQSMEPAQRAQFAIELAYHAALAGSPGAARGWLAHAAGGLTEPSDLARADAAIAVAEGEAARARASIAAARAALPRSIDRGGARWAADCLDRLEARLPG